MYVYTLRFLLGIFNYNCDCDCEDNLSFLVCIYSKNLNNSEYGQCNARCPSQVNCYTVLGESIYSIE